MFVVFSQPFIFDALGNKWTAFSSFETFFLRASMSYGTASGLSPKTAGTIRVE